MIRVRTLGQCTIQIDDVRVGPDAEIVFATLLLLTIEPGRRVTRGELLGMLWPDNSRRRASHCLRQTIYRLRNLGVELEVEGATITIAPRGVDSDVAALLRPHSEEGVEQLAAGIAGPFLPGYIPAFSETMREWVERQRDLVTSAARRVLVGALTSRKSRGEWPEVERLAHRCLSVDPLNEHATLSLAEAAALHGAKAEAIAILDRYLREMGPGARELRVPASVLRRRISEPEIANSISSGAHAPFVGRSPEMATLTAALRNARSGTGSLYFIHGEPGIGKTRLLSEFTRAAMLEGIRVAPALCQSSDTRRPLSAFVDIVPKLMAMPGALGCSPHSHAYLRRLMRHYTSDAPPTPETSEAVLLYANVKRSLFDLFDAIASESLLVVSVEDVHWLDPASWEVLAEAAIWVKTRRIMFIVTSRESAPGGRGAVLGVEGLHPLWLGPIDLDARERLAEYALPQAHSALFRAWCVDMSGGNPYYLNELALHGLAEGGQYRLPPTLISLVNERITRLSPASCRVLQVCAVLGKNATLQRVEAVLGEPRTAMLDAMDELENKGLVRWDGICIRSNHEVLSHAALSRASELCRRTLHFHAARCFEETFHSDSSASAAWNAAEHWIAAGEPSRAISQLRNCASSAVELGRPTEACAALHTCLTIPMSPHDRMEVQRQLFLALRIADRNADAIAVLEEVVQSQAADPHLTRHTDAEWELIMAKWAIGIDLPQRITELEICASCRSASVRHRLRAARYAFMLADNMCTPEPARRVYDAIKKELVSDESPDAEKWYCEMVYHTAFGDVPTAVSFARRLFPLREALGDSRDCQLVSVHVADVLHVGGELADSTSIFEHTYQDSLDANLMWIACLTARRLAWQHFETGRLERASWWADLAVAHSRLIQHRGSAADSLAVAAEIALAYGRLTDAADLIQRSGAAWGPSRHARANAEGLALQCTLWIKQGHPENCRGVIEELEASHRELCRRSGQDLLTARCARVHEALGDVARARAAIQRYLPYRRDRGPLTPELSAAVEQLGFGELSGDPRTAITRQQPFEHAVSPW